VHDVTTLPDSAREPLSSGYVVRISLDPMGVVGPWTAG